jgi:hypothetical protein
MLQNLFALSKEVRDSIKKHYFEPRVIKRGKDECWDWIGQKNKQGYSQFTKRFGKKTSKMSAHKVAWMLQYQTPVPPGLICCHMCDNPPCVNPFHIFIGTHMANSQDARLKGRRK